jgi:predicted small metal-binding protein
MNRRIRCDCGHEIVSSDLRDLIERARRHAREEHRIEMTEEQVLAIAEPGDEQSPSWRNSTGVHQPAHPRSMQPQWPNHFTNYRKSTTHVRCWIAFGAVVVMAASGCAGQSTTAATATPTSTTATPTANAVTAAYRRALEQGSALLNSDTGSYDSSCNFGLAPYKDSCRQWALMDVALVNQFLALLSNAQVPAADTTNDQLLRRGLQLSVADDTAAADAIASGNEAAATSALGKIQTDGCTAVVPVMQELDPSVPKPPGC